VLCHNSIVEVDPLVDVENYSHREKENRQERKDGLLAALLRIDFVFLVLRKGPLVYS
jgi:hypothetical protein